MSGTSLLLKGRTALVTGSSSGIGRAIAASLAQAGANVMLHGLSSDSDSMAADAEELHQQHGVRTSFHDADVRTSAEVKRLVCDTQRWAGEAGSVLDILVNNAGVQYTASTENFPEEQWDRIMSTNLSSVFHATKAALPDMQAQGWGRVVNVASVHGLVASANKAAYVTAKHGVVGLTKVVALENAVNGVTCNAICPGWVLTPLVEKQIRDRMAASGDDFDTVKHALLSEKTPSRDFVTPEQVGQLATFLCSDTASQMTGTAMPIDGGWLAQ